MRKIIRQTLQTQMYWRIIKMNTDAMIQKAIVIGRHALVDVKINEVKYEIHLILQTDSEIVVVIPEGITDLRDVTLAPDFIDYIMTFEITDSCLLSLTFLGGKDIKSLRRAFFNYDQIRELNVLNLELFEAASLIDVREAFRSCEAHELKLGELNLEKVFNIGYMFAESTIRNLDLTKVRFAERFSAAYLMYGMTASNVDLGNERFSGCISFEYFCACSNITNLNLEGMVTDKQHYVSHAFSEATIVNVNCIENIISKQLTSTSYMFKDAHFEKLDLSKCNMSRITSAEKMFAGCSGEITGLSCWNTAKLEHAKKMFKGASIGELNLSQWNTQSITNVEAMFEECTSPKIDISSWNLSNITDMSYTFCNAKLGCLVLDNVDTSNLEGLELTFCGLQADKIDISSWKLDKLELMNETFENANVESINLKGLKLPMLQEMRKAFYNCKSRVSQIDMRCIEFEDLFDLSWCFRNCQATTILIDRLCVDGIIDEDTMQLLNIDTEKMFEGCSSTIQYNGKTSSSADRKDESSIQEFINDLIVIKTDNLM